MERDPSFILAPTPNLQEFKALPRNSSFPKKKKEAKSSAASSHWGMGVRTDEDETENRRRCVGKFEIRLR